MMLSTILTVIGLYFGIGLLFTSAVWALGKRMKGTQWMNEFNRKEKIRVFLYMIATWPLYVRNMIMANIIASRFEKGKITYEQYVESLEKY